MSDHQHFQTARTQSDLTQLKVLASNRAQLGCLDYSSVAIRSRNLPHWRQSAKTYFVTFRLADSLPIAEVNRLRIARAQWDQARPEPRTLDQQRERLLLFSAPLETYLDAGYGDCWLQHQDAQEVLREHLFKLPEVRVAVHAWVTMPNHLHLLVTPTVADLSSVLRGFKGTTARRINQVLGRKGVLWQKESFDHIVRSPTSFQRFRDYIFANPAHLEDGIFEVGVEVDVDT